jgi:predicted nucleic acid-binding protein
VNGPRRVVVDTSSLVRAALDRNSAAARLLALLRGRGLLVASLTTLEEVAEVLMRPKFARRLPEAERRAFLEGSRPPSSWSSGGIDRRLPRPG